MTAVVVRLVLIALCVVLALFLLRRAVVQRRAWRVREAGIDRAERWWGKASSGPFDQDREGAPDDVIPYLGASGPRTDWRRPRPAQAEWVWGWLFLALAALLGATVGAQMMSGLN